MSTPLHPGITTPTDTAVCDACHHPDAAHDVVSRRYCAATMAGALSRACICPAR